MLKQACRNPPRERSVSSRPSSKPADFQPDNTVAVIFAAAILLVVFVAGIVLVMRGAMM